MTGFILTSKTVIDLPRLPSCHAPHLRTQAKNIETASQRSQCCARKLLPTGCDSLHSLASSLDQATSYAALPRVRVEPLYFSEQDLTADRMLAIMGCDNTEVIRGNRVTRLDTIAHSAPDDAPVHAFRASHHP